MLSPARVSEAIQNRKISRLNIKMHPSTGGVNNEWLAGWVTDWLGYFVAWRLDDRVT